MEKEVDPVVLEILRLAKDLVINEYTDRRANVHNQWLIDAESSWRNSRTRVPYPVIPPYPTELDIVLRAQVLLNFLNRKEISSPPINQPNIPEVVSVVVPEKNYQVVAVPEPIIDPSEPPNLTDTPIEKEIPANIAEPDIIAVDNSTSVEFIPEPVVDKPVSTLLEAKVVNNEAVIASGKILPSFLKKLEEMKNLMK